MKWFSGMNDSGISVPAESWLVMRQWTHGNRELIEVCASEVEAQALVEMMRAEVKAEWESRLADGWNDPKPSVDIWCAHSSECAVEA